ELEPRRLARSVGLKAVRLAPQKEAERLTGLQVGGIGALALTAKNFTVCLDRTALDLDRLVVNGGRRGFSVRLAVDDLIALTGAQVVDASSEPGDGDQRLG
ncbi:MAG TPA: YbaK/EbsC family protein, partial [Dehalococcoidia bacterium]|nr:YbaK/EbsC family protein [Dehalococcoidia bacterium]